MPAFLVVQTSFLGDMILTTPLLARLATQGTVDVVCTPAASGLLANHPAVHELIVYDKRGADRGIAGLARLGGALSRRRYDAAFLAQGSVRSGALALLARVPKRIGFGSSAGRLFYTSRVVSPAGRHHAARLLSLADNVLPRDSNTTAYARPRLYPGESERADVDTLLRDVHPGDGLVALAPGSVWATKRWPYYGELARLLAGDARIVVVGSADDHGLASEITAASNGRAIDATGRLSLLASAELIGRCALLVTNDSAPLHLASAMNTPTLAVFGPTVPAFGFGPLAERSAIAQIQTLECRPCDRHGPRTCPLGHWRCMREITAADAERLARTLLAARRD